MSPRSQARAFGKPGQAGNPGRIAKLANEIMDFYDGLLDWSARLRALAVPPRYRQLRDIASEMVDAPITQVRHFIDRLVGDLDDLPKAIREHRPVDLVLSLDIALDDNALDRYIRELQRLEGGDQEEAPYARRSIPERVRNEVWRRDQGRCVDCGSRVNLEFDHIIPSQKAARTRRGTLSYVARPATAPRALVSKRTRSKSRCDSRSGGGSELLVEERGVDSVPNGSGGVGELPEGARHCGRGVISASVGAESEHMNRHRPPGPRRPASIRLEKPRPWLDPETLARPWQ
jgi:hypothetical protein